MQTFTSIQVIVCTYLHPLSLYIHENGESGEAQDAIVNETQQDAVVVTGTLVTDSVAMVRKAL
jgi:hypothetical protein